MIGKWQVAMGKRHMHHESSVRDFGPKTQSSQLKAQVSIELLVTVAVVIAFAVPVLFLLFSISQFGFENASVAQADGTAKKVADNINELYAQGSGSKMAVLVNLPSNMEYLEVKGNEVVVKMKISSGDYEAVSPIFGTARDFTLTKRSGPVVLTMFNNNGEVELNG